MELEVEADRIEVLLEIGESRRVLTIDKDHLVFSVENELGKVGKDGILAYFSCEPGGPHSSKNVYILQRWDAKWNTYVDVSDIEQVVNGDRLICTLQDGLQDSQAGSQCSALSTVDRKRDTRDFDTAKGKHLVSQASDIVKSLKSPSQKHVQALAELFPSSTAKQPRLSPAFDPTAQCIAFSRHQKKKGNPRLKPSKISFVLVASNVKGIPRGKHRTALKDSKQIMKVDIVRTMSATDVKRAVLKAFSHVNLSAFEYQSIDGAHHFQKAEDQEKDGDAIISYGAKGFVYIKRDLQDPSISELPPTTQGDPENHELPPATQGDPDISKLPPATLEDPDIRELPPAPIFASRPKKHDAVAISDSEDNSIPVSSRDKAQETVRGNLEEFCNIRAQQDREYEESLQIDRHKSEEADRMKLRQEELLELRQNFQHKYAGDGPTGGCAIKFRFPDGKTLSYNFLRSDPTKVLYEFVFSVIESISGFKICTVLPMEVVPCCGRTTISDSIVALPSILTVTNDEDIDLLTYFQQQLDDNKGAKIADEKFIQIVDGRRLDFVHSICPVQPVFAHLIRRNAIYGDVMGLFQSKDAQKEYPLRIHFKDEVAYDDGGVSRDMFSAFWEEVYRRFFDGACLLTPSLHATTDMSALPLLGQILSHGFLISGYIPIRIAFPSLAGILLGPTTNVSSQFLIEAFAESLCSYEATTVKEALESSTAFSKDLKNKLIAVLSRYGSRVAPTNSLQLRAQLSDVAKYEFLTKPMAAINGMHSGISSEEKLFWRKFSIDELHSMYMYMSATPEKVLNIIEEPIESNPCEMRVFNYLQQYIGNMRNDEVRRFLRFTTGSSVLIAERITVAFNGATGLTRHPIGHTCPCLLELPTTYTSYPEFEQEFNNVLTGLELNWEMQGI